MAEDNPELRLALAAGLGLLLAGFLTPVVLTRASDIREDPERRRSYLIANALNLFALGGSAALVVALWH